MKLADYARREEDKRVAPRTGAWIETLGFSITSYEDLRRAPHGRVD